MEKTKELVLNDKTINLLADKVVAFRKRENTVLPVLQKQLDDVEKAIFNLLDAIQQGLFNASAKKRLDDLESRKMDLEISIAREKIEKSMLTHEKVVHWMKRFKDGDINDTEHRKNIIDSFVNSVYLYDDHIMLNYNSEEGAKTVTFSYILSSNLDDSPPP